MCLVLVGDSFIPKGPWELLRLVQAHRPVFGSVKLAPIKNEKPFVPRHMKSDKGLFWKSTSRTTLCLLFLRKLFNHFTVMSSVPHLNNLYSKPSCGTLSNALLKEFMLAMNGYGPQGDNLFLGTDFPKVKLPGEIFHGYIIKREGKNKREQNVPKCFKVFVWDCSLDCSEYKVSRGNNAGFWRNLKIMKIKELKVHLWFSYVLDVWPFYNHTASKICQGTGCKIAERATTEGTTTSWGWF